MNQSFSNLINPLRHLGPLLCLLSSVCSSFAQAGRIYTAPDADSNGAITGHISTPLSHAIAIEHDRVRVFLAELSKEGLAFTFNHIPSGKYDLVLVTKTGTILEGLALGSDLPAPDDSRKNLEKRISLADGFFNHFKIHRTGLSEDGETAQALVERYRAENVLKQSGEALGKMVRRLEVIELTRATDDWQLSNTRHFYREGEPPDAPHFLQSVYLPMLESVRIVGEFKDLGEIPLMASPH